MGKQRWIDSKREIATKNDKMIVYRTTAKEV